MKIKTLYFGIIEGDELSLSRLAGVIEDAAAYNLQQHYIKVHGDLMNESKRIRNKINERESQRDISTTTQRKRQGSSGNTSTRKKQTGVHKESDPE